MSAALCRPTRLQSRQHCHAVTLFSRLVAEGIPFSVYPRYVREYMKVCEVDILQTACAKISPNFYNLCSRGDKNWLDFEANWSKGKGTIRQEMVKTDFGTFEGYATHKTSCSKIDLSGECVSVEISALRTILFMF